MNAKRHDAFENMVQPTNTTKSKRIELPTCFGMIAILERLERTHKVRREDGHHNIGSPPGAHCVFLPSTQLFWCVLANLLEEKLNERVGDHSHVEKHSDCKRRCTVEKSCDKT